MKYLDRRERLWNISTNPETLVGSTTGRGTRKNSSSQGSLTVEGYADADWAGFPFDRRSTSGYCCTFVGSHLVTCKKKKHSVVARSSAEAEYRAMALVAQQLIWIKILLSEMGFPITRPMDKKKAAIYISTNPVFHERTKHIEMDCHFLRERVLLRRFIWRIRSHPIKLLISSPSLCPSINMIHYVPSFVV